MLNEVEDYGRKSDGSRLPLLLVGILASIATTLTPPLVKLARDRFANPEVSVFAGIANEHPNMLRSKRADLEVTADPLFEIDGLVRKPLLRDWFLLVLNSISNVCQFRAFFGKSPSLPASAS